MNNHIQQHIETLRVALADATSGPWYAARTEIFVENGPIAKLWGEGPKGKFDFDNYVNNARMIANSPTWLQQSIEMLEQQQREIADKDREIAGIEEEKNKAWSIVESLSKQSGESPNPGEMTYNDRFQLDSLIKEFGAGYILDYVNNYSYREVSRDVQDDR